MMYLQRNTNSLRSQIVQAIQQDIFSNRKVGDQLPSEAEYAEEFGVTRSTIQKALKDLQQMNLITRVQGKGSFVHQTQPRVKLFNFKGFSDYAHEIGSEPINKVLSKKIIKKHGTEFLELERLRLLKNQENIVPMTVDHSELNLKRFPDLDKYDFGKDSLYYVIRRDYKIIPSLTTLRMKAVSASGELADLLNCDTNTPLLQARGVVHDENGEFVENVVVTYSNYAEFDLSLGI